MARSDPAGGMSVALASFSASSWEGNGPISVSSPPSVSEYEHQNHVSPRLTMLKGIARSVQSSTGDTMRHNWPGSVFGTAGLL